MKHGKRKANTFRKVRIFVASPGDVKEERDRLAKIVDQMNRARGTADRLGLTLEVLRWETHVAPDIGRPQGIVFEQLDPETWDIFVGILWMRFGTPTGLIDPGTGADYRSGTEEEFDHALSRRNLEGTGWPKIRIYRCLRPPNPLDIEVEQYGRVQNFFKQFEPDGTHPGLYATFSDTDEFERLVREHLERDLWEIYEQLGKDTRPEPTESRSGTGKVGPVALPGAFRYLFDRYFPRLHTFLTTRMGLFPIPSEWRSLNDYLSRLHSTIAEDIKEKTYVEPSVKKLPDEAQRLRTKRTGFLTPIQQLIKEVVGVSHGGDAQSARISAISKKSKFVRNIVKRLMNADEPLILLGDPGTGKSITLQQAAMLIAEKETKRIFPTVCLFIRLGEFQSGGNVDDVAVWEYVKRVTPEQIRPFLEGLKASGRLAIFFDGMDEMSRENYNEHTAALSLFAAGVRGRIKTLFSCRITDFSPSFRHNRLVLLPFGYHHIYRYLKRQVDFPIKIGDRTWTARQLARHLAKGGLPMQADNPFVLWLLCTYLQEEEEWPKSRVHLLEYYNRSNYKRKLGTASGKAAAPNMNAAFRTWGRIAYEITNRNRGVAIPLPEVESILPSSELPAVKAGIQCGVLQESMDMETPLLRFEHHRFQEYFTALHLSQPEQAGSDFDWLGKLDAPRWQETLFNLVLMGEGEKAIIALSEAIKEDIGRLQEMWRYVKTLEAIQVETILSDRVELASRVLQQTEQQSNAVLTQLAVTFKEATYRLANEGNPITKVKMLWASRIVPGSDIFLVAREALLSNVAWVRQQALIITSATPGAVGRGALQEDVLHSFASGRFLDRLAGYFRIAAVLKQKQVWSVLIIGFVLCLFQIIAVYGLVMVSRKALVPAFNTMNSFGDSTATRNFNRREQEAIEKNDQEALKTLRQERETRLKLNTQVEQVARAAGQSINSWWFLSVLTGAMLLTLLYASRRMPGQQYLAAEAAGSVVLFLILVLWLLWLESWGALFISIMFFLPLFITLLGGLWWVLTLLIQSSTLLIFIGSTSYWTGTVRKRMLFEAMWENCGFRSWGSRLGYAAIVTGLYCVMFLLVLVYTFSDRLVATLGLFSFLPTSLNILFSALLYAEVLGCLVTLVRMFWRKPGGAMGNLNLLISWTKACFGATLFFLVIWVANAGHLGTVWRFVVANFGLFVFFPSVVNLVSSLMVYAEILGILTGLVLEVRKRRGRSELGFNIIVPWTKTCLTIAFVPFLIWGLTLVDWRSIGKFIAARMGLFHFFPPLVNAALSIAVYLEVVGIVVSLVARFRKTSTDLSQRKIIWSWTTKSAGLAGLTFLGWAMYSFPDLTSRVIAIILSLAIVIIIVIILGMLMRDVVPFIVIPARGHARFNTDTWKQALRGRDSHYQATLLRRTTPAALNLQVGDFLTLLQEVEPHIEKEPALSAYWAKRYQVEQIIRQERVG